MPLGVDGDAEWLGPNSDCTRASFRCRNLVMPWKLVILIVFLLHGFELIKCFSNTLHTRQDMKRHHCNTAMFWWLCCSRSIKLSWTVRPPISCWMCALRWRLIYASYPSPSVSFGFIRDGEVVCLCVCVCVSMRKWCLCMMGMSTYVMIDSKWLYF